jgi:hypothetical protein
VAEAERDRTRERIAEVKRDQRQRGHYLGCTPPFGWRVGAAGELVPVPEQQAAIKRMRRLKDQGLALRDRGQDDGCGGPDQPRGGEAGPCCRRSGAVHPKAHFAFVHSGLRNDCAGSCVPDGPA